MRIDRFGDSNRVLTLCLITALFEGADTVSLGLAAPQLARELALRPSQIGLALSASLFGLILGSFIGGRLSDQIGRKRVLIISMLALGVFSLATTIAPNVDILVLLRCLVGVGLGGAFPILIAFASETRRDAKRATAIGVVYSGQPIGAALLSLLMSVLGATVQWRTIFYVGGFGPLLLIPILFAYLPESLAFREEHRRSPQHSPTTARIRIILFGRATRAVTLLLWSCCAFTLFVIYLLLSWIPSLMIAKGLSAPQSAMVSTVLNCGGAAGVLLFGTIVDRGKQKGAILGCYFGLLTALTGLAILNGFYLMMMFAGFAGCFMLGSQLVLYSMASNLPLLNSKWAEGHRG
jgi:AAHS family 3-hydroxyphenylpropionic acid transporter